MKTGILKWRPDYSIAADHYERAGRIFHNVLYTFYLEPILGVCLPLHLSCNCLFALDLLIFQL